MKMNPILKAVYILEHQEGSISNVDDDDPRLKKIVGMYKHIDKPVNELSENASKILELLHYGYEPREIATKIGMKAVSVRQNIKKYNLLIKYTVIQDTYTKEKKLFRSIKSIAKMFKKLKIPIGYSKLIYSADNQKLLDGRYRIYRVKQIRKIKQGAKYAKGY
ncbi:hypothetical protein MOO46_07870 (plasmid) [Apilactobacillus apisilvae]|uniref:Uncharacterized protein n=1 Tax=Apilactobacillus apisilvae TaxID=2923364 RepID=A0ABY4PJ51_9LACO|nr:hypothetical protein [Apilactobacillus apisilvae]UQS85849.1 hypothetical protein MOO46_07870 [Apilactobacillus apisilvae]